METTNSVVAVPGAPTVLGTKCDWCGEWLVQPFTVKIFRPDCSEETIKNHIVSGGGRMVVVYTHDSCKAARKKNGRLRRLVRHSKDPAYDPIYSPVRVPAGRRVFSTGDLRVITDGPRFLMVMPRM